MEEISEKAAAGETAAIYAEIRAGLCVPMVNLIYRHMATRPDCLEWAWGIVAPCARSGALQREAGDIFDAVALGGAAGLTVDRLSAAGIDADTLALIGDVVDAYNRANPMNVIAAKMILQCLEAGRPAPRRAPSKPNPPDMPALPPLIDVATAPSGVQAVLRRLARQASGGSDEPVPTLYRHFGDRPVFLSLVADVIDPFVRQGGLAAAVVIERSAERAAERLLGAQADTSGVAAPIGPTKDSLSGMLREFPATICGMIVIGRLLRSALPL